LTAYLETTMSTRSRPRQALTGLAALLAIAACRADRPDAYGNFESDEVVVSAEASGQLLSFEVEEGRALSAGALVGAIDTAQLVLQRRELLARRAVASSRTAEVGAQIDVLAAQHDLATREYERTRRLHDAQASTSQQLDRAERDYRTLGEQIKATRTSRTTAREELGSIDAQVALVEDRLRKSRVINPLAGLVLTTYAEPGEYVQPGQPLYKIANTDTLTFRAYVSGAQLAAVRIGASVGVRVDAAPDSLATLPGRVTWVAAQAEFTPTPIQTRDERAEQVYAVKVRVPNPGGALKIGMPGELVLAAEAQ
jgi:HlyD family secretion protein